MLYYIFDCRSVWLCGRFHVLLKTQEGWNFCRLSDRWTDKNLLFVNTDANKTQYLQNLTCGLWAWTGPLKNRLMHKFFLRFRPFIICFVNGCFIIRIFSDLNFLTLKKWNNMELRYIIMQQFYVFTSNLKSNLVGCGPVWHPCFKSLRTFFKV